MEQFKVNITATAVDLLTGTSKIRRASLKRFREVTFTEGVVIIDAGGNKTDGKIDAGRVTVNK